MKRTVSAILLAILLTSMLYSAFKIMPAEAAGTIYIRADGSVDPPTAPIQKEGDLYTLSANISDSIVVQRNNITIDGAGFTLQGAGSECGFNLTRVSDVTIRNTRIVDFNKGIYIHSSDNNCISHNDISAPIFTPGWDAGTGVDCYGRNNLVASNNIHHVNWGIGLYGGNNTVIDNELSSHFFGVGLVNCGDEIGRNRILNNNIPGEYGIELACSYGQEIVGNRINTNGRSAVYGIYLNYADRNIIYLNAIYFGKYGVDSEDSGLNFWSSPVQLNYTYGGKSYNGFVGNYWGRYENVGGDADGDGIGLFFSSMEIHDSYPLVRDLGYYGIQPTPPDFFIFAEQQFLTLQEWESDYLWIDVYSMSGFSQPVNLAVSGVPTGVTASFSEGSITPLRFGSSFDRLTIYVYPMAAVGDYILNVTGTSGTLIRSVKIRLRVAGPDFSISASPTSLSIQRGSSGSSTITVTSIDGFNQPVQLTGSGAPSGVTTTLNPQQVTPPAGGSTTSTLTVSVATTATPGNYTLGVTGTIGALTHTKYMFLEITSAPPHPNQPPNTPTFLFQYRADGTEIPVGETIVENTVVFKGVVSDSDGDRVHLQVELRNFHEYSGKFNEAAGGFKESETVSSGNEVAAFASELVDESYHWRARTIDEHGLASDWVDFGGNDILEPDFIVTRISSETRLSDSLKELKEAIRFKLSYDVSIVAQTFTSVKDYWRAKRWADIFSPFLEVITDTFSLMTVPSKIAEFASDPTSEYQKSKGALELMSLLLMYQGLVQTGENAYTGWYGPSYVYTIEEMLEGADECFFFNYDSAVYRSFIDTYLKLPPSNKQSPLMVPRKSGDLNRKTVELSNGMIGMYVSISKRIRCLIDDMGKSGLPEDFPVEEVIAELANLKTGILQSCLYDASGGKTVSYDTYLKDGEAYVSEHVSLTLGAPAQLLEVFKLCAGLVAEKTTLEIAATALKTCEGVADVVQVYKMSNSGDFITVKSSLNSEVFGLALNGLSIGTELELMTSYSDTEKQFYGLPQEMVLALPTEFSNLWMMVDDIDRRIRHEIDISSGTPEGEIGAIVAELCSPGVLQVCDSEGRLTGVVNGLTVEEIPNSECFNNTVIILSPNDTYCYKVIGTELGFYGLKISLFEDGSSTNFTATEIPTSPSVLHNYTIDWSALSRDEEGVAVQVDSDGDGIVERTFTSDSELTGDEFQGTIVGDITQDGIVDIFDLVTVVIAYGSTPSTPSWDARCDLNEDSVIDVFDLSIVAINFGKEQIPP